MVEKEDFVLVHGSCHGAWCWYKLIPLLQSAGHKVTAIDLAASGIRPENLDQVPTLMDYTAPLLEILASLPDGERVILVGHSYGGLSIALAAEIFPHKVAVLVFAAALMPDCASPPSHTLLQLLNELPPDRFLDTKFEYEEDGKTPKSILFGPRCLESTLYQNCSPQDVVLAKSLVRTARLYIDSLSKSSPFLMEKYGSVNRVYILSEQDRIIPLGIQLAMIKSFHPTEVKEVKGSDHVLMLSQTDSLFQSLLQVAQTYL